jgi:uncharacterized protein YutE (UPF0331/DUF86 family)
MVENLRQLETLRGRTESEFLKNAESLAATKYWLQTAIQAMIDITSHICARLRIVTQPDSGECIRALQKQGFFSQEHATMYIKMIRFRNVLVHLYGEVDDKRVHEILENELDYFRRFLMEIETILEKQGKEKKRRRK